MSELLTTLLNAIHEDGGQHTAKVGDEQSVRDAIAKHRLVKGHSEALAIARNDLAALRIRILELEQELDETHGTLVRTGDILRATANAIHGGPLKDGFWSHHDLPELATLLRQGANAEALSRIKVSD